jgi:hypothetical protein
MAGTSPAMTVFLRFFAYFFVMLGLDPSIHVSPLLERMTRVSQRLTNAASPALYHHGHRFLTGQAEGDGGGAV